MSAKLLPMAAKSKASKTTLDQYDETLDTMLTAQKGVFAFERLREELLKMNAEQQQGVDAAVGASQKGKGKQKAKAAGKAAKKRAAEEAEGPSDSDSDGDDELPEGLTATEYLEIGLKNIMEVDQRLRNRLEILQIAVEEDWETGKVAQELLQGDNSKSLKERAKKGVLEKRKAKRDEEGGSSVKKRKLDRPDDDYYGGRGRPDKGRKPYRFPPARGGYGGHGFEFDRYAEPTYERPYRRPRYSGPTGAGYR
jgi:hypothetical protein